MECQPEFSPFFFIDAYTSLLKKDSLFKIEGQSLDKEIEKYRKQLEVEKKKNDIPRFDTIIIDKPYSITFNKPFKKYKIQILHDNYKSVKFRDSFPICEMTIRIQAELQKIE